MWQQQLLEEIQGIDIEQAPHGLYGLPQIMAVGKNFHRISQLLAIKNPQTSPALRLGWIKERGAWRMLSGQRVSLTYMDFAATKVRHYGSGYQLDRVHGTKDPGDLDSLPSRLAELHKEREISAKVLIAHMPARRRFEALLGKTTSSSFLERYFLQHHALEWEDRYDRGFFTGLFIWNSLGP